MQHKNEILFVSHDANRAGAQIFLYNVMKYLQEQGYGLVLLLANDWGSMRQDFEQHFTTYSMQGPARRGWLGSTPETGIKAIRKRHSIGLIYVNTIASVHLLEELKQTWHVPLITHIHELAYSIGQYGPPQALETLFRHADIVVACSDAVAANLRPHAGTKPLRVIHSFVNNEEILKIHEKGDRAWLLSEWQLSPEYTWVAACGNADWRKAPDVFLQIAARVRDSRIRFAWIGIRGDDPMLDQLTYDAAKLGISEKVVWLAPTARAVELINAMDLFLLCSREDPFPLVMLEAALCGKAILSFKNTGGGDEFIETDAGWQVNYLDVTAMADTINAVAAGTEKETRGQAARAKVLDRYSFEKSMEKIRQLVDEAGG